MIVFIIGKCISFTFMIFNYAFTQRIQSIQSTELVLMGKLGLMLSGKNVKLYIQLFLYFFKNSYFISGYQKI